jgi:predicted  nucleic acid-binding Zn-ribbon protein
MQLNRKIRRAFKGQRSAQEINAEYQPLAAELLALLRNQRLTERRIKDLNNQIDQLEDEMRKATPRQTSPNAMAPNAENNKS